MTVKRNTEALLPSLASPQTVSWLPTLLAFLIERLLAKVIKLTTVK